MASGHDTAQQQPRAEPGIEENGIPAQRPEPPGRCDLLQPDKTLNSSVSNSDGQVQWNGQGRDLLHFQATGEPDSSVVQRFCNPEHPPGLLVRRHPVDRDRNFLPKNDYGLSGGKKLHY